MRTAENNALHKELFSLAEPKYKSFMARLLPTVDREAIIGVRAPALRKIAKRMIKAGESKAFLKNLPHIYYEENYIHALIIAALPYSECIYEINRFLPYVDNWGICDGLRPVCFVQGDDRLVSEIFRWLSSEKVYTVRFAIEMLMLHFLAERFKPEFFEAVAAIRSDEYYLNMMIAWYFATALAERYEDALPYLEAGRLLPWVHNKTISKAVESYRLTPEKKQYLKSLRIKQKDSL